MDPDHEHGESPPAIDPSPRVAAVESAAPPAAAPIAAAAPADAESAIAPVEETAVPDGAQPSEPGPPDALSPAVRRLVRQYDLDITGVYGSGPAGKIRVGDIIGMLDGRAEPKPRTGEGPSRGSIGAAEGGARFATSGTPGQARLAPTLSSPAPAQRSATTPAP